MKAYETLIAWTPISWDRPTAGQVEVGLLLTDGDPDWTKPYAFTGGAAYTAQRKLRGDASLKMLFVEYHTLVVRDGLDPQTVHKAFLVIDDYAKTISPDIDGAKQD